MNKKRKHQRNRVPVLLIIILLFFCAVPISHILLPAPQSAHAHPGRTDANGGHWNRKNGTYHYHTGEYAGQSSGGTSSVSTTTSEKNDTNPMMYILYVLFIFGVAPLALVAILLSIHNHKEKKKVDTANAEYRKFHVYKRRSQCTDCRHCQWGWHHPFKTEPYYTNLAVKMPFYCKKFKTTLENDPQLRCISKLDSEAMYEKD